MILFSGFDSLSAETCVGVSCAACSVLHVTLEAGTVWVATLHQCTVPQVHDRCVMVVVWCGGEGARRLSVNASHIAMSAKMPPTFSSRLCDLRGHECAILDGTRRCFVGTNPHPPGGLGSEAKNKLVDLKSAFHFGPL